VFIILELQCDKNSCTYGGGDKTLDQRFRCVRDSLLAYHLKITPATNRALYYVQTYEGAEFSSICF
jgi:hypothetical protein